MNSLNFFLKTEIEGTGALSWVGNLGLAPYRYLFNGKTVSVVTDKTDNQVVHVHDVSSFHNNGADHHSTTEYDLVSSEKAFYKLVLAVVLLIPGLILSVCKALSYLFEDVQQKNALAQQHFTPINRTIGTKENPITSTQNLENELYVESQKPLHQRTNAIIIYGDGNLEINAEPGILRFNPAKIILVGAKVVHKPCGAMGGRLDDAMMSSGKWKDAGVGRVVTSDNSAKTGASAQTADSVDAALNEPNPSRGGGKTFHVLYQVKA